MMMRKVLTICAVVTMILAVSGVAQATPVGFNFDPADFFNYNDVSGEFSTDGGMFKLHKTWEGDRYRSWDSVQRPVVDAFKAGLGSGEGIGRFNIWLADSANAPLWGEDLVSSGSMAPTGSAPSGWTAEVVGNPWAAGEDGLWLVRWSTTDPSKYIRPGNSVGEFGFTFEPTTSVTLGEDYTIWFGGINDGTDSSASAKQALYFDTFTDGFPSQFVEGDGSGFEATLSLTAVPEPATLCLLGLGGLMLRRRKSA
jgi:hypothetical protein